MIRGVLAVAAAVAMSACSGSTSGTPVSGSASPPGRQSTTAASGATPNTTSSAAPARPATPFGRIHSALLAARTAHLHVRVSGTNIGEVEFTIDIRLHHGRSTAWHLVAPDGFPLDVVGIGRRHWIHEGGVWKPLPHVYDNGIAGQLGLAPIDTTSTAAQIDYSELAPGARVVTQHPATELNGRRVVPWELTLDANRLPRRPNVIAVRRVHPGPYGFTANLYVDRQGRPVYYSETVDYGSNQRFDAVVEISQYNKPVTIPTPS